MREYSRIIRPDNSEVIKLAAQNIGAGGQGLKKPIYDRQRERFETYPNDWII